MTTDTSDLFIKGQRIDRYEIRAHIGQGGMGAVYRAVDTKLGRTVALKTVVSNRRGDRLTEEIRERFMREALAASRVDHRNVVQVLDFGFVDDGTPYMVMEYLRGKSLGDVLRSAQEPLALDYVADIMLSVCAALRACHHVGIIHRDLKPANIFLCDTDTGWEVKVLDFGISKATATDALTDEGQIIGTPQYLSPEQVDGTVGPESDQYALGVLMYVCLTQRLPFADYQGVQLLHAIAEGKFAPPGTLRAGLPEDFEAIVLRAMHVSPKDRFESIHALGQRLWKFASVRGQEQWKTFYFHTPAAARPSKPVAIAPVATAPVSSSAAAPAQPPEDMPRAGSTASLEPVSALAKTQALRPPKPDHLLAPTKTAAAAGVGEATSLSHSDIAGESGALSEPHGTGGGDRTRRRVRWQVAAAAVGVICAGVIILQRPWRTGGSAAPVRPVAVSAPATAPTATPAAPVAPAAPTTPVAPAPTEPTPAPVPAEPTSAPVAKPPESATEKSPAAPASRKKHATHRHKAPKMDQQGIGIPTE
ncbi:MAG TPA: protein kinase [Polyangia bacterium]|jgi:serine/threonine-protein kinase|nr:protein kinase [Polyangia bacterium]